MSRDPDSARLVALEEQAAHLARMVEELSDLVAAQDRHMARLTAEVRRLSARTAEAEAEAAGRVILGDERPPHY